MEITTCIFFNTNSFSEFSKIPSYLLQYLSLFYTIHTYINISGLMLTIQEQFKLGVSPMVYWDSLWNLKVSFEGSIFDFHKSASTRTTCFMKTNLFLCCHVSINLTFLSLSVLTVDGSGAGSGNLEILVNGGHVTSFVRNLGNQRFLASFVPHEALSHLVEMKFNGETVPGKFRICRIFSQRHLRAY